MKKFLFLFLLLFLTCPVFVLAEQIDINAASLEQLDELSGIGPKYAQAIINARPFSSVDDLLKVKGIGEKTLQKIKEQGLACVSCAQETQEISNDQIPNPKQIQNPKPEIQNPTNETTTKFYPDGIFINEILPSPEGADEENEWIELYNSNNFEADLSGWKLQDTQGTQTIYVIPKNTKIAENEFLILKRPETKITLNNEGDGLALLTPDGAIKNSINFSKAPIGQSYNKSGTVWQWSLKPTPREKNIVTATNPSARSGPNGLPETKKSDTNNPAEAGLAGISNIIDRNQDPQIKNPWFLFFIALTIAIISASAVLYIKIKFKQQETKSAEHNKIKS